MSMAVGIAVGAAIAASSASGGGGSSCPINDCPWWLAVATIVFVLSIALMVLEMVVDLWTGRELIGFNNLEKLLAVMIVSGLIFSIGGTIYYCS